MKKFKIHRLMSTLFFLATLMGCTSSPKQTTLPNQFRTPAGSTVSPLRIILMGSRVDVFQRIGHLKKETCVVHGFRGTESLVNNTNTIVETEDRRSGLGWDDDKNKFVDDKYGWKFGPNKQSRPISSLQQELSLAGEWQMLGSESEPLVATKCAVIFPILLESEEMLNEAVKYLVASKVLNAYSGPVEIHHASSPALRSAILNLLSGSNYSGVTDISLFLLQ